MPSLSQDAGHLIPPRAPEVLFSVSILVEEMGAHRTSRPSHLLSRRLNLDQRVKGSGNTWALEAGQASGTMAGMSHPVLCHISKETKSSPMSDLSPALLCPVLAQECWLCP